MTSEADKKIECWAHLCLNCGHTTYFMVGGGSDIICHRCWGFNLDYLGRKMVTKRVMMGSLHPGNKNYKKEE